MTQTLAAPLAQALAARGYTTLTPVQEAVLADDAAGRDLLVSAQTGSGKTVAFGVAIAPDLLADTLDGATAPRALVIAPTRELALQVRREFEWLYEGTGATVASCVGGMDWRTERRALERGAAIVVGTPGRLRDHIERGTLDLTALKAAVLDEADEMLDLGFAEDLEFILAAAPETRRTLMFSATVPKEIEALATTYQRDALRIVARGEARAHADIAYRALSVGAKDKENAVLNLLRLMEPRMAIVFAKTRAGVAHLMARMANRGLSVVALSGELSQGERTHALQSLRDGRARICVATDVAARGIDLPGLELVVHFDLPSNPETLLHRSGRTGRAGAKGQAVLIVPPSDFRKAQRILTGAKVTAEWGKPPSADEVQAADDERLMALEALAVPPTEDEAPMVARLASFGDEALAAAVLRLWRAGRAAPEELHEAPVPSETPAPVRERAEFGPAVWYALSAGHDRRVEARWLLPKLCEAGGITRLAIGAIRVQAERSFVQVAEVAAARLEAGLGAGMALEDGLVLTRLPGEPDLTARAPRAEAPPRPRRDAPLPRASDRPQGPTWAPRSRAEAAEAVPDAAETAVEPAPDLPAERPRKAPAPRPLREEGERKPYAPRGDGARSPRPDAERRPYAPRVDGERKPYAPRAEGERKPYGPRPDGDRKPYGPRGDAERKPYAPRAEGERKPYGPRPDGDRKPYGPRGDAERKPYAPRAEGERKPYGPRPAASADTGRKPPVARGAEDDGGRKPYAPRTEGERKPYAPRPKREDAERKPYGPRADRAAPKARPSPGPEDRPRRPAPAAADGEAAPKKARWTKDDPRRTAAPAAGGAERPRAFAPRAPKAPPPNPADPSQSLRKRPSGGPKGAPRGKPGPKRG